MGALDRILVAVRHLMLFQAALGHETFAALLADERTVARVNGPDVRLHIHQFAEALVAKLARMHVLLVVRQVHRLVDVQLLQRGKAFRALAAHERLLCLRVRLPHVCVEQALLLELDVAQWAPAIFPKLSPNNRVPLVRSLV